MKVVTDSETIDLGVTEIRPTIEITDFSRRVTDDFGVTTVVPRAFSRRMSVRFAMPTADVDRVQRRLAELRATAARWTADPRFAWLDFRGFYKDLSLDLAVPPLSYCTLTVEGLAETETVEDAGGDPAPDGRASTLLLLQPVDVTDAVLLSSNVPEYDHPEWSPGISYAKGAKVIRGAVHRIYESAADDNEGNDPTGGSGLWIDIGPTNRWAMFDQALGTATSLNDGVTVTLSSGAIRAIALLDVVGATVRVQGPGYDRTQAVGAGAVLFGDLPGGPGDVIVTIAGAGSVAVGTLLAGKLAPLGITGADAAAGINDFSRKERDDFGEWTVVPRSWSKTMATKAVIRTDAVDLVANRIAAVRARPSLWIAAENLDCLTVYGFFKTVSIEVGANVSILSLAVEGLSEAAPLSPGLPAPNWPDIVDSDPARPKPEDGATVGGTIGENVKDTGGNVVPPEDLLTSLGISADTVKVAGVDGNDLLNAISTAQDEIDGLIETYGETAAASAAAQEARDARDVALGAATVAGGHASTASTKRDEASGFMLAAQGSAVAAGDAAGVATAKAAAAGASESSAAASASVSANYAEGARRGAVATMPSTFEQDGAFWSYLTGSETTAVRPEDAGYPITYPTTQDGKVLRVNNSVGYTHVSQRRRINLASVKGRRFRIRVAARLVTPPATGTVELRVGLYALTENFSQIVYGGYYDENITGSQYAPMTGAGLYEAALEFTISNSIVPDGNGYTPVWSTFGGYLFNPAAPNLTGIVDFISIEVDDITESQAAKAEAGIAADQAAIATAAGSAATDSKNITAAYRDDVLNIAGNFDFARGIENWNLYADHTNGGINDLGTYFSWSGSNYFYRPGVIRLDPNVVRSVFNKTMIPIDPSREYEFSSFFGAYAASAGSSTSSPPAIMYVGFVAYDAAGSILDHGAYGSYRYCLAAGTTLAHNETLEPKVIVTGEGNDSWTKFPPGTRYIRLMAIMNYLNVALNTYLDYIKVEDVTARQRAAAEAGIANTAAAVAEAARAAAQRSEIATASLGKGYLNPGANFAGWTADQPEGWYVWNYLGGNTFLKGDVTFSLGHAVYPEGSPWFYRSQVAAGDQTGLAFSADLPTGPGTFLVEATTQLLSGDYGGSGVLVYCFDSAGNYIGGDYLPFASHPDTAKVASSSKIGLRRFSKSLTTPSNAQKIRLYAMSNYATGMGTMAAKDIAWLKCGLKPAGATEATVLDQASVLATHDMMLASRLIRTSAGAGYAELAMSALDSNGQAAGRIGMTADWISFGSANQRTMEVVDGLVRINGNLYLSDGLLIADAGANMKVLGKGFGVGNSLIEWFGPKMAPHLCSEANAISCETITGQAYYAGAFATGSFRSNGGTSNLSPTAEAMLGPIGTNGNPISVAVSWIYRSTMTINYPATTVGQNRFDDDCASYGATHQGGDYYAGSNTGTRPNSTLQLERKIGTGALGYVSQSATTVENRSFSGHRPSNTSGDPGDATTATLIRSTSTSFTFVDTAGLGDRTYRAAITRGFNYGEGSVSQTISIVTQE